MKNKFQVSGLPFSEGWSVILFLTIFIVVTVLFAKMSMNDIRFFILMMSWFLLGQLFLYVGPWIYCSLWSPVQERREIVSIVKTFGMVGVNLLTPIFFVKYKDGYEARTYFRRYFFPFTEILKVKVEKSVFLDVVEIKTREYIYSKHFSINRGKRTSKIDELKEIFRAHLA